MHDREEGRVRVEKYKVNYQLVQEASREESDARMSLHYTPLYGPVPGYEVSPSLVTPVRLKQ